MYITQSILLILASFDNKCDCLYLKNILFSLQLCANITYKKCFICQQNETMPLSELAKCIIAHSDPVIVAEITVHVHKFLEVIRNIVQSLHYNTAKLLNSTQIKELLDLSQLWKRLLRKL